MSSDVCVTDLSNRGHDQDHKLHLLTVAAQVSGAV